MTLFHCILPGMAGFLFFLILHVVAWQVLAHPKKGVFALTAIALLGFLTTILFTIFCTPAPIVLNALATSAPLYAFLTILYFHFYFGVVRSLSVRILGELSMTSDGRLTPELLDRVYPKREMVAQRIEVLVRQRYLSCSDERYSCTKKGLFLVRLALLGKRIYHLDATG